MPTRRQRKLNELLLEEISLLVPGQMEDPRLTGVRVTRVESTQDLSTVKVYVTLLDEDASVDDALQALEHASGRLRTELGAVGLRRIPRLVFAHDKAFESGQRVLWLLDHMPDATATSERAPDDPDNASRSDDASAGRPTGG